MNLVPDPKKNNQTMQLAFSVPQAERRGHSSHHHGNMLIVAIDHHGNMLIFEMHGGSRSP